MDSKFLFEIKPKFVPILYLLTNFRVWVALVSLILWVAVIQINGRSGYTEGLVVVYFDEFVISCYVLMFGFILFVIIMTYIGMKNYAATVYCVYDDRIEMNEGFINHQHISIFFDDIKEVHLTQNIVQCKYNVATIKVITAANNFDTGIKLIDIEYADEVCEQLRKLIKDC